MSANSKGKIGLATLSAILLCGAAKAEIRACSTDANFPPFSYRPPGENAVRGFTPMLLRRLAALGGFGPVRIDALPWRRCLLLAAYGSYQLVLDAPTAEVDAAPYLVSESYYAVHSNYYYSADRWPNELRITQLDQLRHLNICGLLGNTFDGFGLDSLRRVDTGATNYPQLIGKIHSGRCDLFIEKSEVVAGMALVDPDLSNLFSNRELRYGPVPEEGPTGLHFLVSRKAENARRLLEAINQGLDTLQRSGELDRLGNQFFRQVYR